MTENPKAADKTCANTTKAIFSITQVRGLTDFASLLEMVQGFGLSESLVTFWCCIFTLEEIDIIKLVICIYYLLYF